MVTSESDSEFEYISGCESDESDDIDDVGDDVMLD